MDELRLNCPWDQKQTWETLRHLSIEEVYELSDAIIKKDVKEVKNELGDILKETEKEEGDLIKKSSEYESKIDESLLISYKKIRSSVRNGLAVVAVERGASAGSFFTIPPQVQLDIASRKKFITDEHSGRILVDKESAEEENEKMAKLFTSI